MRSAPRRRCTGRSALPSRPVSPTTRTNTVYNRRLSWGCSSYKINRDNRRIVDRSSERVATEARTRIPSGLAIGIMIVCTPVRPSTLRPSPPLERIQYALQDTPEYPGSSGHYLGSFLSQRKQYETPTSARVTPSLASNKTPAEEVRSAECAWNAEGDILDVCCFTISGDCPFTRGGWEGLTIRVNRSSTETRGWRGTCGQWIKRTDVSWSRGIFSGPENGVLAFAPESDSQHYQTPRTLHSNTFLWLPLNLCSLHTLHYPPTLITPSFSCAEFLWVEPCKTSRHVLGLTPVCTDVQVTRASGLRCRVVGRSMSRPVLGRGS